MADHEKVCGYVASCPTCAAAKGIVASLREYSNRLLTLSTWKEIFMNFTVELPESLENTVIWVTTNLFSKQVHFVVCLKIPLCTNPGKAICATHLSSKRGSQGDHL